jgi:hypothetical protein
MNIKNCFVAACSAVVLFVAGCTPVLTGGTATGFPVKDTKTSRYTRPVDQIAGATLVVLNREGKLTMNNTVNNTFIAKVNERTVWVKITKIDDKISEVAVQARSGATGDMETAAEIDKQIALQLTTMPPVSP